MPQPTTLPHAPSERKRLVENWENSDKIDLKENGSNYVDWNLLA
jgi:hypothetical protein